MNDSYRVIEFPPHFKYIISDSFPCVYWVMSQLCTKYIYFISLHIQDLKGLQMLYIVVVQSLSHIPLFAIQWTTAYQASLSLTISWSLPKLMFIASVMVSNYLVFWCPLPLLSWSFPSSETSPMSHLFASNDQNTRPQLQHQFFEGIFSVDLP